ncbi:hypothetical protein [Caulobacter sp.]|uniref:hypothetical protein n=1 Tax=Caulobacter sp. TaxID=78 RepID=UPI002B4915C7|nr:hypothetical protein [Caulobacter sp.]HJV41776.1 hypothetical protein [Caulobacter sp.]
MTPRALVLTTALAAVLAACGHTPDGPGGPGGREIGPPGADARGPMGGGPQLFISPAGEPFRAPGDQPYPVAAWFAGADANHDGALSRDEFVADSLRFFAVVDVDHNGVIDGFEVSAYENRIAPEIVGGAAPGVMRRGPMGQGPGGGDGPPGGGRGPGGGGRSGGAMGNALQGASLYGLIAEPEPVMGADADFNRRITKDEATRAAKTRFALLDVDKDGVLKLAELPKTPAQLRLKGGKDRGPHGGRQRRR